MGLLATLYASRETRANGVRCERVHWGRQLRHDRRSMIGRMATAAPPNGQEKGAQGKGTRGQGLRIALLLALLAVWGIAIAEWPALPARVPIHFDLAGRADGWMAKSAWTWFALPLPGTVLGLGFGFLLPHWMVALARRNSRWLDMPRKAQFTALPAAARERAVRAPARWLLALACLLEVLLAFVILGSAEVARGDWDVLPTWPAFALVGALLACAAALGFDAARAVRREVVAS
jgi:hypothetical protein